MELNYVTINKEKYPFILDFCVLENVKKELAPGIEYDSPEAIEEIFFQSLKRGFSMTGRPFDFIRKDAEFMLDQCYYHFVEILKKFFEKNRARFDSPLFENPINLS